MKAEIKFLYSPQIEDLSVFRPNDPACFAFLLQMMVGPEGAEGEESFDLEVCTPKWLVQNYGPHDILVGRHYLIVFEYDYARLKSMLGSLVSECVGQNWQEIAERIGRIGKWEFEDYVA
jgi:hypothetical protein